MQKLNASSYPDSERLSAIKAQPKDLKGLLAGRCVHLQPPKEIQMNRTSIAQRLVLITLATLASTTTFALMVLAPMAIGGGLA